MVANFFIVLLLMAGCGESPKGGGNVHVPIYEANQGIGLKDPNKIVVVAKSSSKTHNGITYSFRMMSATDFLTTKGEQVVAADRAELEKETVVIVTFNSSKKGSDIFELEQMTIDKEAAIQYLIGALGNDVTIEQAGESFKPKGVHYETSFGEIGHLRAFLYFDGVRLSNSAKVVYYDRLFGAGLLRFEIKK